jgi:small ligand-binding sensory domain FIST
VPFAAAVSVHPVTAHAAGEVIGRVVEEVGTHPDLVVLLVSPGHAGALEDVARTITTLLAPTVLIGATAPAVIGDGADGDGGPGLALWAGLTGPVRAWSEPVPDARAPFAPSGFLVLASPGSVGAANLVGRLEERRGTLPVAGAISGAGPLVLGDRILAAGTVGAVLGPGVRFEAVVARGWRPVGPLLTVTDADTHRGLLRQLDGVPALDRLRRLTRDEVPAAELPLMRRHLAVGPAGSGDDEAPGPAAEVVWEVRGADRSNGAIATDGAMPPGTRIHFWVRDDPGRHLRRALLGRSAETALVFVADPARRGYDPMGANPTDGPPTDGDAGIVADQLGIDAVAGMVAPGQIGSVGGSLRALEADASLALLTAR